MGKVVILTDGDVVFQPRKIERSGLFEAVDGNILIYIHKEQELADVERRYPADRYVLVDDKLRILTAIKAAWGERVTTVFPRQGHYALDAKEDAQIPAGRYHYRPDRRSSYSGYLRDPAKKARETSPTPPPSYSRTYTGRTRIRETRSFNAR